MIVLKQFLAHDTNRAAIRLKILIAQLKFLIAPEQETQVCGTE